jgi:peptidyl-prolyl cis-trans isomerase D
MLEGLRAASQNWIGRTIMVIVMGFIILSFAIWGIGDIFGGFGANALAKVGAVTITTDAYRNAYQTDLQRMQANARRAITNEEAHRMGLDAQVLGQLVSDALLDQKARELGLAISDDQIAKAIVADDAFKGITGTFDPARFQALIRENGYTERSFVAYQRGVYLRREISEAVIGDLQAPQAMADAIHKYQSELRSIDYVTLTPAAAGDIPAPTEDQLKTFFEARRGYYETFETRNLVLLSLDPASLAKPEAVSDADAEKRYDEVKAQRYTAPEKRTIAQIVFPTAAEAAAAKAKIDAGASFDAIAAERKLTAADISLGTVARSALVDKAVAEAAFALPEGGVSAPVTARFGTALLHVTAIVPATVKPFAEVAPAIKQEIATQRAKADIVRLHDSIEDQRASGKTLSEAAKSVGLTTRQLDGVDARGRDKAGKPVPDLPDAQPLLKAAFASDVGVDNDTLATPAGGYVWFEVTGIDPAHRQSLDEVKDQLAKDWTSNEIVEKLAAKARDMVKEVDGGKAFADVVAANGGADIHHVADVKRAGGAGLSSADVVQVFNTGVHGAGSAEDGENRVVFQVLDSSVPPLDKDDAQLKALMAQVKPGLLDDVLAQYLGRLRATFGVTVNNQALQGAIGAAEGS